MATSGKLTVAFAVLRARVAYGRILSVGVTCTLHTHAHATAIRHEVRPGRRADSSTAPARKLSCTRRSAHHCGTRRRRGNVEGSGDWAAGEDVRYRAAVIRHLRPVARQHHRRAACAHLRSRITAVGRHGCLRHYRRIMARLCGNACWRRRRRASRTLLHRLCRACRWAPSSLRLRNLCNAYGLLSASAVFTVSLRR